MSPLPSSLADREARDGMPAAGRRPFMSSALPDGAGPVPPSAGRSARPAWVLFDVARQRYALPAEAVVRITPAPPLAALPFARPMLPGAANVAGEVVVVLDAAQWLCLAGGAAPAVLMVLRHPLGLLGLLVDRVKRIASLPQADQAERALDQYGSCTIRDDEGDVTLLRPSSLPQPDMLHHLPQPTSRLSLTGQVQTLRELAAAGATDRRTLLAFASADQSFALPIDAVARIRDRDDKLAAVTSRKAHALISLAALVGAQSGVEEPVVIDVAVAGRSASLAVGSIIGLRQEDDRFSAAAAVVFLRRLIGE